MIILLNSTISENHIGSNSVETEINLLLREATGSTPDYIHHIGEDLGRVAELEPLITTVFVNAEGTLHGDSTYVKILCNQIKRFICLGIPTIILNATLENLSEDNLDTLRQCTLVCCRDTESQRYLGSENSTYCPDLAFNHFLKYSHLANEGYVSSDDIIVTCSKVKSNYLKLYGFARLKQFLFLSVFMQDKNGHVKTRNIDLYRSYIGRKDVLFRPIFSVRLLKAILHQVYCGSIVEFLKKITRTKGVITGRYHVVVACIALNKKFAYLPGDTNKIDNFLKDVGVRKRPFNEGVMLLTFNAQELKNIQKFKSEFKKKREHLICLISKIVER